MSRYFVGQGKVHLGGYPTPNYRFVGNSPQLSFSPFDLDYIRKMSGAADILPAVDGAMSLSFLLEDLSAANLQPLLGATQTTVNAANGHTKVVSSLKGATFYLGEIASKVTSVTSAGPVTYTAGTDYIASYASITIPATSSIVDGTSITITYNVPAHLKLDPFQGAWSYYSLFFEGINMVDGKPYAVEFYKLKLQFLSGLALITDSFQALQVVAMMMPDSNNSGKYYSIIQQE